MSMKIGFIGLGQMGAHMARSILRNAPSTQLTILDTLPSNTSAFLSSIPAKVRVASSPREVAQSSDVVITMLPSTSAVESVYIGNNSLSSESGGKLLIDSSTIDPLAWKSIVKQIKAKSIVDAPVSGGVLGAENGTLTFMVGGTAHDFQQAQSILKLMGKNIVHCGEHGTGQIAKICNNLLLGTSMLAVSETLNLGIRLGMDASVLSNIIATSTGRNWSLDSYNPVPGILPNVPSSRGYTGGFGVKLMLKDLRLASDAAKRAGVPVKLGELGTATFEKVSSDPEFENKDFSVVYQWIKQQK